MPDSRPLAFVTGAARGIGRATATEFSRQGYDVAVVDLVTDTLGDVADECRSAGVDVVEIEMDQRSSAAVDSAISTVTDAFGRLDVMANIAGVFPMAPFLETTDDEWADVLQTNLTGMFYCCRAGLRAMRGYGSGNIINVASGAAVSGVPGLAAYSASKAGVVGMSRVLAHEAAPEIRVNVVAPGPTKTEGVDARIGTDQSWGIPLERWAEPEEIARGIAFLASDDASFVHGVVFHINGGRFMP